MWSFTHYYKYVANKALVSAPLRMAWDLLNKDVVKKLMRHKPHTKVCPFYQNLGVCAHVSTSPQRLVEVVRAQLLLHRGHARGCGVVRPTKNL